LTDGLAGLVAARGTATDLILDAVRSLNPSTAFGREGSYLDRSQRK
jgi:hypothetical protein